MQTLFTFGIHKGDFRYPTPVIRTTDGFRLGEPGEKSSFLTNAEVEAAIDFFGSRLYGHILKINEVNQ